jgi:hypothetical protein
VLASVKGIESFGTDKEPVNKEASLTDLKIGKTVLMLRYGLLEGLYAEKCRRNVVDIVS